MVDQSAGKLLTPIVKVFYSVRSQSRVQPKLIDLGDGSDRIIAREEPEDWNFQGLEDYWKS